MAQKSNNRFLPNCVIFANLGYNEFSSKLMFIKLKIYSIKLIFMQKL